MKHKLTDLPPKLRDRVQRQMDAEDEEKRRRLGNWNAADQFTLTNPALPVTGKRVRQDRKPNKLEADWAAYCRKMFNGLPVLEQAMRLKLANGFWYKPDVVVFDNFGIWYAYECKGPSTMKGVAKGVATLKMAATQWPMIRFKLVWRQRGQWQWQDIES